MAVQQNKKSPSRRNMRRSQQRLTAAAVSIEKVHGDPHRRHHIAANGYYRGRQVLAKPAETESSEE